MNRFSGWELSYQILNVIQINFQLTFTAFSIFPLHAYNDIQFTQSVHSGATRMSRPKDGEEVTLANNPLQRLPHPIAGSTGREHGWSDRNSKVMGDWSVSGCKLVFLQNTFEKCLPKFVETCGSWSGMAPTFGTDRFETTSRGMSSSVRIRVLLNDSTLFKIRNNGGKAVIRTENVSRFFVRAMFLLDIIMSDTDEAEASFVGNPEQRCIS